VEPPPERLVWTQFVVIVGYCIAARDVGWPWTTSRSSRLAVGSGGTSSGCEDAAGVVVAVARAVGEFGVAGEEGLRLALWYGKWLVMAARARDAKAGSRMVVDVFVECPGAQFRKGLLVL